MFRAAFDVILLWRMKTCWFWMHDSNDKSDTIEKKTLKKIFDVNFVVLSNMLSDKKKTIIIAPTDLENVFI